MYANGRATMFYFGQLQKVGQMGIKNAKKTFLKHVFFFVYYKRSFQPISQS